MRLLHQRHDHEGQGAAGSQAAADRGRGARGAGRQSLPLRHPQSHHRAPCCAPATRWGGRTMNAPTLTRRGFAKGMGGLVLAFSLDPRNCWRKARPPSCPAASTTTGCWTPGCASTRDGNATVITGKVELGQGILTALWQIAAEELDLPLSRVAMISGRHRAVRRTRARPRAASRSRTAARRCATPAPRCARC